MDFGGVRLNSSVLLNTSVWYHVAVTKANSPQKLASTSMYINGAKVNLTVDNYGARPVVDYIVPTSNLPPLYLVAGQGVVYNTSAGVSRRVAFTGYIGTWAVRQGLERGWEVCGVELWCLCTCCRSACLRCPPPSHPPPIPLPLHSH